MAKADLDKEMNDRADQEMTEFVQANMQSADQASPKELLNMTSNVVAAYLGNHKIEDDDVPNVIERVYQKLKALNHNPAPRAPTLAQTGLAQNRDGQNTPNQTASNQIAPNNIINTQNMGQYNYPQPQATYGNYMMGNMQYSQRPAVAIEDSVQPDYIICLEDGVKLKMLKRHLRTAYRMTPEQYRSKWGLPPDYPMVAPNYAKLRSSHAKRIGLGKKNLPPGV